MKNPTKYREDLEQLLAEIAGGVSRERCTESYPTLQKYLRRRNEYERLQTTFQGTMRTFFTYFWDSYEVDQKIELLNELEKRPENAKRYLCNLRLRPLSVRYFNVVQQKNEVEAKLRALREENDKLHGWIVKKKCLFVKQVQEVQNAQHSLDAHIKQWKSGSVT